MVWGWNNKRKLCNYGTRNPQRNSWGDKLNFYFDSYASCSKDAEIVDGKNPSYCKEHGCPQCFYEMEGCVKVSGNLLCKEHYNKYLGDKKLAEIEYRISKIKSLDGQLETELKGISNDFYILIEEPICLLNQAKEKFIRQQITNQMFAVVAGGSIVDAHSVLSSTENNEWKGIYNPNNKVEDICQAERNFLIGLTESHKSKSDTEKARLTEEAQKKTEAERKKQEELR